jgi:hypothetical protein
MMNVIQEKVDMKQDVERAKELKEKFFQLSDFEKIEKLEEYRKLLANERVYFRGYDYFKHFKFQELANSNLRKEFLYAAKNDFLKIIKKFRSGEFKKDLKPKEKMARVFELLEKYSEEEIKETVDILEEITSYWNAEESNEVIEEYLEILMDYNVEVVFRDLNVKITEAVFPFMSMKVNCKSLLNDEYLNFFSSQEIYYGGHTLTSSNFIFYSVAYLMRTNK